MAGLGNEDFRKLIAESKPAKAHKQKKKAADPEKVKAWKKKHNEEEDDAPKYRDRAEERRKGLNPDYQHLHREVRTAEWEKLSTDQTKFLGGDMDRAHLVKGLDYALLNKVRKDETEASEKQEEEEIKHPTSFTTPLGRCVYNAIFRPPPSNIAEMFRPRRMAFVFFDEEAETADNAEPGESSMPYTLNRSKADCPEVPESMAAVADAAVLAEVVGIMKSVKIEAKSRGNRRKGRDDEAHLDQAMQEKERHIMNLRKIENPQLAAQLDAQPQEAPEVKAEEVAQPREAAPADVIFDDVGDDYEVDPGPFRKGETGATAPASSEAARGQDGASTSGYFGKADDMKDLPAIAQHGASLGKEGASAPAPPPPAAPPYPNQQYTDTYGHAHHHSGYGHPGYGYDYSQSYGHGYGQGYGYDQQAYYAQGSADGMMPPPPPQVPAPATSTKGKGFEAKMGDRAVVRHKFSKDERRLVDGAATFEGSADDMYGVDMLLGAGGMEEEEEDLRDMDKKGRTLNRADFETDEQFNSYKSAREAAPKAAFQFGVKVADGRRSHKDMDRKMANKLETQLGKIQKVFNDKGFEAKGAFSAPESDSSATPARKRMRLVK